jgi:hypothetical protein
MCSGFLCKKLKYIKKKNAVLFRVVLSERLLLSYNRRTIYSTTERDFVKEHQGGVLGEVRGRC